MPREYVTLLYLCNDYWGIGKEILARQSEEGWGKNIIPRLAKDLAAQFPAMKGLSPRNLGYMKAFAEAWPDDSNFCKRHLQN